MRGFLLVPRIGFEPMAYGLEGRCSIQLSYRGILMPRNLRIAQTNSKVLKMKSAI